LHARRRWREILRYGGSTLLSIWCRRRLCLSGDLLGHLRSISEGDLAALCGLSLELLYLLALGYERLRLEVV
jgi:hypothetical protein